MLLLLLPLLGPACSGGDGSGADYTLRLEPVLPKNQAGLFDDLDRLDLVITTETGSERFALDAFGSGQTSELSDMARLTAATLSLEGYVGETLEAFGTTDVVDLSTGDEAIAILVARVNEFAELTNLPDPRFDGSMSYDGAGSIVLFGGNEGIREEDEATPEAWALSLSPPSAGLVFEDTKIELGPLGSGENDDAEGRIGASATLLTTGSSVLVGQVLVAGGTQTHFAQEGSSYLPAAGIDVGWSAGLYSADGPGYDPLKESKALGQPRSHHTATENAAGDVVVVGGFGHTGPEPGYLTSQRLVEVFSPALGEFAPAAGDVDISTVFHAAARLGTDGVLACGGYDASTGEAVESCWEIDTAGQIDEIALPATTGLVHLGMAPLPNGRVLLAGGLEVSGDVSIYDGAYPASRSAWIYDGSKWVTTTSMNHPHAMHGMVALPDGRVLVVGGTTGLDSPQAFWGIFWDESGAIGCAEVFDPATVSWTDIGSCDESTGDGVLGEPVVAPMVAVDPRYGALVVGGINRNDKASSQVALFVSAAPGN